MAYQIVLDVCPNDPNKEVAGICGCGTPDIDSDNDGIMDCMDGCPDDEDKIAPGLCGCDVYEPTPGQCNPTTTDGGPLNETVEDAGEPYPSPDGGITTSHSNDAGQGGSNMDSGPPITISNPDAG